MIPIKLLCSARSDSWEKTCWYISWAAGSCGGVSELLDDVVGSEDSAEEAMMESRASSRSSVALMGGGVGGAWAIY